MIKVIINNKETELPEGTTIGAILERRGVAKAAVWVNGRQLKKAEYAECEASQGDKIKILRIMAGG